MITYGAYVCGQAASTATFKQKATRLHSLALRQLGHFRKGTPTAGLEVIMGLPPLEILIQSEVVQGLSRQFVNEQKRKTFDFFSISSSILQVIFFCSVFYCMLQE